MTSDALQVATEAHASTDLAGALTQHPGRASPSSALAPAAPLTDPSCLKSKLPAQAVLRVSAKCMGCKCIHGPGVASHVAWHNDVYHQC